MKALGSVRFVLFLIILAVLILNTARAGSQLALAAQGQWGTAALIEQEGYNATSPSVAVDASGNAVAVWSQSDSTRSNIWANRYVAGTGWGSATLIEVDNAGGASAPQVAVGASGNAVAVWMQSDGTRYNIWANRYVAGTGWGSATLIEVDNAGGAYAPEVAVDASGNAVAVWYQLDSTRSNIWANRYVAGTGWVGATLIEVDNAGDAGAGGVAVDASGNAVAVWSQSDGTRNNIWANRYVAGTGWGSATLIEVDNAGTAYDAKVAVDASGNAVAVWRQSDGTRYNIWANRYVAGTGWGSATLIEVDNAGGAYDAKVAVDASGNAVAVWWQGDGTRSNIWANRYVAGTGWGSATLIEVDNAGDAEGARVAADPSGNAVAVWYQGDGTRSNIWANCYFEAPVISSVEPAQATAGQTLQVLIHGEHLTGATTVSFGPGITVSIMADNATQITASISISGSASPGARDVSVTTPGGTATTKTGGFTVWAPPTISTVSPNSGVQGQSLSVAITGTYFTGATTVDFGPGITVSSPSAENATLITASISISGSASPGARDVSVTTPGGTATKTGGFTVWAPPTISTVSPNSGVQGQSLSVTMTGTYFTGATTVSFGPGITVSITADNATQITASISISGSASPGARDVSVTTPGGTATATAAFTVNPADSTPPVVLADKSPTKTASCIITVTGTASDNASGVGVVMYSIDGRDAWYGVTSLVAESVGSKECTYTIRVFLPPGTHTVEIRATDSAGNTSAKKYWAEVTVTTGSGGVKAWVVVIAVLGTLALLGAISYLVWRYRGKIRERSTQKVNEAKQKLSE